MIFDVLANDIQRRTATRGCKTGRRPQDTLAITACNFRSESLQSAIGYAFEAIDQFGEANFWRIVDEQMTVVVFTIAFNQLRFKVVADLGKDMPQVLHGEAGENVAPVFGDKYPMDM